MINITGDKVKFGFVPEVFFSTFGSGSAVSDLSLLYGEFGAGRINNFITISNPVDAFQHRLGPDEVDSSELEGCEVPKTILPFGMSDDGDVLGIGFAADKGEFVMVREGRLRLLGAHLEAAIKRFYCEEENAPKADMIFFVSDAAERCSFRINWCDLLLNPLRKRAQKYHDSLWFQNGWHFGLFIPSIGFLMELENFFAGLHGGGGLMTVTFVVPEGRADGKRCVDGFVSLLPTGNG